MKKRIEKLVNLWLPPLLWALLIFHFSSGGVPVASDVYWQDFAVKKFGHVLLFGTLALLLYRGFRGEGMDTKKSIVWAIALSTLYGASDEFHQTFTQGREARIRDIFIDGLGATVFTGFIYYFLPKLPKKVKSILKEVDII